jgi:DNA-binding MarR family transcriptional regulator
MVESEAGALEEFAGALLKVFERLADLRPEMTLQQAKCLLVIAAKPGITQRSLMQQINGNDSTVSRHLAQLSDLGDRNIPGMDVIKMQVNLDDRRERVLHLTPKGRRLLRDSEGDLRSFYRGTGTTS